MKSDFTKRLVRFTTLVAVLVALPWLSGCRKPPAAKTLLPPGPPELTQVSSEEAQLALDEAAAAPQEHFVKRSEAKPTTGSKKSRNKPGKKKKKASASRAKKSPASNDGADNDVASDAPAKKEKALREPEGFGSGIISTPLSLYFGVKIKLEKIKLDQTLQHYKTLHGKPPQTHKEFMKEIIKKGKIKLPELRDGERYQFDPDEGPFGTLMIERSGTLQE